jgi:excisionase family DNA binding protein
MRKDKTMKDTYMTVGEIAEMLKISYDKALEFVKYSGVEYVLIGRQYRVLESKLNAFLYPPKKVKQPLRRRPIYQIIERK